MAALLYRLGSFAARRVWQVIVAWVLILGFSVGAFLAFGGSLSNNFDIPGTASGAVVDELTDKLPDSAGMTASVVYQTTDGSAFTDEQKQAISDVAASAEDVDDVATVLDPFDAQQQQDDRPSSSPTARSRSTTGEPSSTPDRRSSTHGKAQLDAGQEQLTAARAQAEAAGAGPEQLAALDAQQAQLDAQTAALQEQQDTLDASRAELDDKAEQVEQGTTLLGLADGIGVVSEDGSTAIVNVTFDKTRLELPEDAKQAVIDHFESQPIDGVKVYFGTELAQGVPELFGVGEAIGLVFAAIVLIVTLGSLIAASLPIVTALVGVAVGVTASLAFSGVVNMASVTPVLGVMLGLAVGIDYSLFIVYRHRKQLIRGVPVRESIGLATGTAGTAVVFAGSTVIVALLALNVTGIPFLGLMGTVGAVCVAVAVLVAITLAPAILGLVGTRLLRRKARARIGSERAAHRATKAITPMSTLRAILTVLGAVALLLVIAIPSMSMRLGLPDGSSEPAGSTSYQAFQIIEEEFGAGANGPLLVTATSADPISDDDLLATQVEVAQQLADLDDVVAVAPIATSDDNTLLAFQVVPEEGPNSESTEQLVQDIRALPPVDDLDDRRRRTGREQHRHLAGAERRPADLPRGRGRAVVPHHDPGVPLAAGAAHRDRRLRAVAVRDVRPDRERVPVGLGRVDHRRAQHRSDPELPAGHPGRHPVRARDGLPALPRLGHARGVRPRFAREAGRRAGLPRGALGRHRGRAHHGVGVRRVHLLGLDDDPLDRVRARVRRAARRVRGADAADAGPDAPARPLRLVAAALARPHPAERRPRGRLARARPPRHAGRRRPAHDV